MAYFAENMNNLASSPTGQFHLLGVQSFKMNSPEASAGSKHRVWVLELIVSGRLLINIGRGNWINLDDRSGVLYAPGTFYREHVGKVGEICHSVALFFEVEELPQMAPWERFDNSYFILRDPEKLLLPLAENSLHHLGLGAADTMQAAASFMYIIAHLLRAEVSGNTLLIASGARGNDIVSKAHQFMRGHLAEPLQLQEIADVVGMSVSGFAHNYKRQTGISPMMMLRRMRVEAAKSYLMRQRFTLSQIAQETGFADAFHLSRTFKEITGVSPRQFRSGS